MSSRRRTEIATGLRALANVVDDAGLPLPRQTPFVAYVSDAKAVIRIGQQLAPRAYVQQHGSLTGVFIDLGGGVIYGVATDTGKLCKKHVAGTRTINKPHVWKHGPVEEEVIEWRLPAELATLPVR